MIKLREGSLIEGVELLGGFRLIGENGEPLNYSAVLLDSNFNTIPLSPILIKENPTVHKNV